MESFVTLVGNQPTESQVHHAHLLNFPTHWLSLSDSLSISQ